MEARTFWRTKPRGGFRVSEWVQEKYEKSERDGWMGGYEQRRRRYRLFLTFPDLIIGGFLFGFRWLRTSLAQIRALQ